MIFLQEYANQAFYGCLRSTFSALCKMTTSKCTGLLRNINHKYKLYNFVVISRKNIFDEVVLRPSPAAPGTWQVAHSAALCTPLVLGKL